MFTSAFQFVSIMVVAIALLGCTPTGGGKSPLPPTIGPAVINGTIWPNEPLTVYFSDHGTLIESVNTVALNDLYFTNPYAFQIQLGYQFPSLGLEIQENGSPLTIMPARTNTKSRPSRIDPNNGQVLEWDWPYPANMTARGQPPKSISSYSIEAVNTCANQLTTGSAPCPNPGAILLLTISPPVQPAKPTHGQIFEYTLIEKGSGNYSGQIATTVIRAIYIEPNRCAIRNLLLQPTNGKAGEVATAEFEATDCRRVKLTAGSDLLFDRVAPTFADNVIDSRRFALPKTTAITVKVDAFDSMMRSATSRSGRINIDPCSISATHPQCPLDCTATPNDSRCPANCTANPNDPRCATPCPRTTDNPNGEYKAWDTGMYCGTFQTIPTKIFGCTFDAAKQSFPPPLGCVYTTITGQPIGECTSGLPKQDFDMCLSCTAQGSTTPTKEYVVERNACSLNDARDSAINARRPRSCVFVSAGLCP